MDLYVYYEYLFSAFPDLSYISKIHLSQITLVFMLFSCGPKISSQIFGHLSVHYPSWMIVRQPQHWVIFGSKPMVKCPLISVDHFFSIVNFLFLFCQSISYQLSFSLSKHFDQQYQCYTPLGLTFCLLTEISPLKSWELVINN